MARDSDGKKHPADDEDLEEKVARLEAERLVLRAQLDEMEVLRERADLQQLELLRSQRELEASHDRYADLYDFAPVSYVTLDANGLLREVNPSVA